MPSTVVSWCKDGNNPDAYAEAVQETADAVQGSAREPRSNITKTAEGSQWMSAYVCRGAAMPGQHRDKCAANAVVARHSSDRPGQEGGAIGKRESGRTLSRLPEHFSCTLPWAFISRGHRCLGKAQSVCTSEQDAESAHVEGRGRSNTLWDLGSKPLGLQPLPFPRGWPAVHGDPRRYQEMVREDPEAALDKFGSELGLEG